MTEGENERAGAKEKYEYRVIHASKWFSFNSEVAQAHRDAGATENFNKFYAWRNLQRDSRVLRRRAGVPEILGSCEISGMSSKDLGVENDRCARAIAKRIRMSTGALNDTTVNTER